MVDIVRVKVSNPPSLSTEKHRLERANDCWLVFSLLIFERVASYITFFGFIAIFIMAIQDFCRHGQAKWIVQSAMLSHPAGEWCDGRHQLDIFTVTPEFSDRY